MVQGWDPDVDITNPSTCQVARQRSNSIDFKADPASSANLTLVVCVSDSKTPSNHSESHPKDVRFTNVDIYTGVTFKMKFLGYEFKLLLLHDYLLFLFSYLLKLGILSLLAENIKQCCRSLLSIAESRAPF